MDRRAPLHVLRRLPVRDHPGRLSARGHSPHRGGHRGQRPHGPAPDRPRRTGAPDQVSGGRFRLGVGRGGPWIDLQVFGTGHDRYDSGLPETLDLLLAGLRGGPGHAAGPLFRFPEVSMVPGPRSRPRPEVVVAATTTGTVELAARRRLPLLLGMYADDDEKAAMVRATTPQWPAVGTCRTSAPASPTSPTATTRRPRSFEPGCPAGSAPGSSATAAPTRTASPHPQPPRLHRTAVPHPSRRLTSRRLTSRRLSRAVPRPAGPHRRPHRHQAHDLHGRRLRRPGQNAGEHPASRRRGAPPPAVPRSFPVKRCPLLHPALVSTFLP